MDLGKSDPSEVLLEALLKMLTAQYSSWVGMKEIDDYAGYAAARPKGR